MVRKITTKEFIRFSNLFGNISPHDLLQYRHPDYPQLSYVTNIDKNGNIDKWGSTKRAADWQVNRGNSVGSLAREGRQ